jgi:hypothetical protein
MNEHITTVCKMGQGAECCKYLVMGQKGFECAKIKPSTKATIDNAWNDSKSAQGDNCDGKEDLS